MTSLAELIKQDLPSFPVSTGNGKVDDPLVITELVDYVGIEYAVARHSFAMLREDYQLSEQRVLTRDGRVIDELVFDVKPFGAAEWAGRRRLFFDITAGYGVK